MLFIVIKKINEGGKEGRSVLGFERGLTNEGTNKKLNNRQAAEPVCIPGSN